MPTRRPDNVQRGVLAETIRARAKRPKITDPDELRKHLDRIWSNLVDLPPGANTVRRRGRY
jgi:hypothetical protein